MAVSTSARPRSGSPASRAASAADLYHPGAVGADVSRAASGTRSHRSSTSSSICSCSA